jgi:hypothetical protein
MPRSWILLLTFWLASCVLGGGSLLHALARQTPARRRRQGRHA